MFRAGFLGFTRNGTVSVSSVLVMIITLSVVCGLLLFGHVLETSLHQVENAVDISVYFVPGTDESVMTSLEDKVSALPEVANVNYISEKDALADFRLRHENDQTTLQAIDELDSNPIGAMLNIQAKDISQYASIAKFFDDPNSVSSSISSSIDHVDYNKNKDKIDAIQNILKNGRFLGFAVTLALIILSIIVTFNTIRLAIYFDREEISVMRLVGASSAYVRGPFIVEGMLCGVSAMLVTLIVFIPITYWFGVHLTDFFGGINLFQYYLSHLIEFILILLVSGVGLGVISSMLAVRKYLKV